MIRPLSGRLRCNPCLTEVALIGAIALTGACDKRSATSPPDADTPQPDTETQPDAKAATIVLRGATVLTATGERYAPGAVVVVGDTIAAVGPVGEIEIPSGATIVELDASQVVTPGIIDTHSHMGVYPSPGLSAHGDGNEMSGPVTAHVRAEDGVWPQDPQLAHALAGGVTSAQILPGSANLIGGRSFTIKLRPGSRSAEDLRFVGAPAGLKMACGENPKRVYGEKGGPVTRMGNVAGYRKAFQDALEYQRKWDSYERKLAVWETSGRKPESDSAKAKSKDEERPEPPGRDFGLETLAAVLDGEILVHMHCYRADEMLLMIELAASFGFEIRSFHHAVEAYKIADQLAAHDIAASIWADWWGFKLEAYDGVRENAALLTAAGGRAIIHSDSAEGIQRLNQEAAKAMYAGRKAGLDISEEQALAWLTTNPAWALGIDGETGSLEPGKDADLVVWSGSPFSVYTRAERVYLDGELVFDRHGELGRPTSDFDLGLRDDLRGAP
jgi:imidazolonepropionase-like amidohydrolase